MAVIRVAQETVEDYRRTLKSKGETGFYHLIVGHGFNKLVETPYPEIEILDQADSFFSLYRRTGEQDYFTIGKVLRKAAHRLYRQFARMNKERPINGRFLNIIKK